MLNIKNNIFISLALLLCAAVTAQAATRVSFDRPNLVVVYDEKGTYGFYTGFSEKRSAFSNNKIVRHECKFMFMRVNGPHEVSLRSLNHPIKDWDSAPYAEGSISVDGPHWQIRFFDRPEGCGSESSQDRIIVPPAGAGTNTPKQTAQGANFTVAGKTRAVGIRWVAVDTTIQRLAKGRFVPTGETLSVGALVVVLKKQGSHSEVDFIDVFAGKSIRGWVSSKVLTDPYPKAEQAL